jgi:hypothetical protein
VVAVDRQLDLGLAVVGDPDALDGPHRDAADLDGVALHELAGVEEVGLDLVAADAAAPEQDQADKHDRSDHRADGGHASDSAQRSQLPLLLSHSPSPSPSHWRGSQAGNRAQP